MGLILNEKYTGDGSYKLFMGNRFLRLFPAYWFILILTVGMSYLFHIATGEGFKITSYFQYYHLLDIRSLFFLILTIVMIIGQDIILFVKFNASGLLTFTSDFRSVHPPFPPVFAFSFVPQSWSLALELFFYFIASFIVRKNAILISVIIILSLSLRIFIYSCDLNSDPWCIF